MTNNVITEVLGAPLGPDWTVDGLAEQLLATIGTRPAVESHEFALDAATDHQSRRLLRPLIACLAAKSAAEAGTIANLYAGQLSFKRSGGLRIVGFFENQPGRVRVTLQRSNALAEAPCALRAANRDEGE